MPGGQFRVRVRVRVRVTVRVRVRASYCDRSAQTYSYLSPSPVPFLRRNAVKNARLKKFRTKISRISARREKTKVKILRKASDTV